MKKQVILILTISFGPFSYEGNSQIDYLQKSWEAQVKPIENKYLTFQFTESLNELGHNFQPWQETSYKGNGKVWCNSEKFSKQDTLRSGHRTYNSKTVLDKNEMFLFDFGDKELFPVTHEMFNEQTFKTARYSPARLLNYFNLKKTPLEKESNEQFAIYKEDINHAIVKLYINKSNNLLAKVTTLHDDELFGDILTTYMYLNYIKIESLNLALDIEIKKIDGKVMDDVHLSYPEIVNETPTLLERPFDYKMMDEIELKPEFTTEKFNENVHLIKLNHTDNQVMIVEFEDFLLVAEAPLNSENGELIIKEASKIAPNKPIKYFVFGHYHPHYLGGVRPFVHKGAKIIASEQNKEYVSYIVNAIHSLNPDSLQLEPNPLVFEQIKDSLIISDKRTEMIIYFIGKKSQHTNDYLIYYFPKEKLIFQDDLVWISHETEIKKASARQAGLYNAIKDLGIEVKTIIQSWPVADYGVKTVIPFEDLIKSMNVQ